MPWKNGRGSTTELYVHDRAGDSFGWRASIATVAEDGPFSRFPGCLRHIMAMDGDGFVLHGGPDGSIDVSPLLTPREFSGDWDITVKLNNTPSRDFNLMADRHRFRSTLDVVRAGGEIELANEPAARFIHVLRGIAGPLQTADSLLLEPGETFRLQASSAACIHAVCRIWPVGH